MNDYVLMTDSGCDFARGVLAYWGVRCVDLGVTELRGEETLGEAEEENFYEAMRAGRVFRTAGVNPDAFARAFREILRRGKDVLYLGLSSGLSTTAGSAKLAARELAEEFPERRILTVDTLCASAGLGLLVWLAAEKTNAGASLEELAAFVGETAPKIVHRYTVDDLKYLRRGGRIRAADAFAATVLDVKPVMRMDESGHLALSSKVRGRRQAIRALAESCCRESTAAGGIYVISHADCAEDARELERLICEKTSRQAFCVTGISPVIGAHSGPGTLAVFYVGTKR